MTISCRLKAIWTSSTAPLKSVTARRRERSASGRICGMQGGAGRMSSITNNGNQRLVLDSKSVMRKESAMPFDNDRPWSFDRQSIESFQASHTGVYAIYNARTGINIGQGAIRQRFLDQLTGAIP